VHLPVFLGRPWFGSVSFRLCTTPTSRRGLTKWCMLSNFIYDRHNFPLHHFSIHPKQFTLSRDAICSSKTQTVNHCTVHKPKGKEASDQQPSWKPDNFQFEFTTGWAFREWNPGGARFCAPIQTDPGMLGLFLRGIAGGAWHWPPTPPSAEVKNKEYRYTSTCPLGLYGLF